jgi:hypothetical protein
VTSPVENLVRSGAVRSYEVKIFRNVGVEFPCRFAMLRSASLSGPDQIDGCVFGLKTSTCAAMSRTDCGRLLVRHLARSAADNLTALSPANFLIARCGHFAVMETRSWPIRRRCAHCASNSCSAVAHFRATLLIKTVVIDSPCCGAGLRRDFGDMGDA